MKKTSEMKDELRPEYDFSQLTVVARGSGRRKPADITVTLERGKGDSVKEINDYWGNASVDEIHNRVSTWKASQL